MATKKEAPPQEQDQAWLDQVAGFLPPEEGTRYPWIQIGHKVRRPGAEDEGAFEIPLDNFDTTLDLAAKIGSAVVIAGVTHSVELRQVRHGKIKEPAIVTTGLHFAFVAQQTELFRKDGTRVPSFGPGVHSRNRYLGICRELWLAGYEGFVTLTVKSSSAGHVNAVRKALRGYLRAASRILCAARGAPTELPSYAVWVPLCIDPAEEVGDEGGVVAPIRHALADEPTLADVKERLIAAPVRDFIQTHRDDIAAWKARGQPEEEDNGASDEEEEDWLGTPSERPTPSSRPAAPPRRPTPPSRPQPRPTSSADSAAEREELLPFQIKGRTRVYPQGTAVQELAGDRPALEQAVKVKKGQVARIAADLLAQVPE